MMNVFKIENPIAPELGVLYLDGIKPMHDFEANIGLFLCLPGEEDNLNPGVHVIISVVEMSREEYDALPEFEI